MSPKIFGDIICTFTQRFLTVCFSRHLLIYSPFAYLFPFQVPIGPKGIINLSLMSLLFFSVQLLSLTVIKLLQLFSYYSEHRSAVCCARRCRSSHAVADARVTMDGLP